MELLAVWCEEDKYTRACAHSYKSTCLFSPPRVGDMAALGRCGVVESNRIAEDEEEVSMWCDSVTGRATFYQHQDHEFSAQGAHILMKIYTSVLYRKDKSVC